MNKKTLSQLDEDLNQELIKFMQFSGNLFSEKSVRTEVKTILLKTLKNIQNYEYVLGTLDDNDETSEEDKRVMLEFEIPVPLYFRNNQEKFFLNILREEIDVLFKDTDTQIEIFADKKKPQTIAIILEINRLATRINLEKRLLKKSSTNDDEKEPAKGLKL